MPFLPIDKQEDTAWGCPSQSGKLEFPAGSPDPGSTRTTEGAGLGKKSLATQESCSLSSKKGTEGKTSPWLLSDSGSLKEKRGTHTSVSSPSVHWFTICCAHLSRRDDVWEKRKTGDCDWLPLKICPNILTHNPPHPSSPRFFSKGVLHS